VATEARGWRSTFRRSIARLVPQPGQNTSSHGVPAMDRRRPQHVAAGGKLLVPFHAPNRASIHAAGLPLAAIGSIVLLPIVTCATLSFRRLRYGRHVFDHKERCHVQRALFRPTSE
jgi:hypothetical protein